MLSLYGSYLMPLVKAARQDWEKDFLLPFRKIYIVGSVGNSLSCKILKYVRRIFFFLKTFAQYSLKFCMNVGGHSLLPC